MGILSKPIAALLKRRGATLLAAILVLLIAYLGFCGFASWRRGYAWQEMDWNQDGSTSIAEFFAAADTGKRMVTRDGRRCVEYYACKDGFPVKTVCPN